MEVVRLLQEMSWIHQELKSPWIPKEHEQMLLTLLWLDERRLAKLERN